MKKFNKGDLVKVISPHIGFEHEELIYLGLTSDEKFHVIADISEKTYYGTHFVFDEHLELVATANYIPIPEFHISDIAYWLDHMVIILDERQADMTYPCYDTTTHTVATLHENTLAKKPLYQKVNNSYGVEAGNTEVNKKSITSQ